MAVAGRGAARAGRTSLFPLRRSAWIYDGGEDLWRRRSARRGTDDPLRFGAGARPSPRAHAPLVGPSLLSYTFRIRARAAGKIRLRAGELRRLHGRASASSAVPVARARSMVVPSALPPRLRRLRRRHGRDPALR